MTATAVILGGAFLADGRGSDVFIDSGRMAGAGRPAGVAVPGRLWIRVTAGRLLAMTAR